MIRIEPDTNGQVLFTNAQFLAATEIIMADDDSIKAHYDIVEERFKQDSVTWARLMLWSWPPEYGLGRAPIRHWIEPDGTVSMQERCDWITAEEWPAWVGTPDAVTAGRPAVKAAGQEITDRHLDSLVWEALPADRYMPYADLAPLMPAGKAEVRASLVRLMEQGLAELVYGRGWRQLHKVVPE